MTYEEIKSLADEAKAIQRIDLRIKRLQNRALRRREKLKMRLHSVGYFGPMPWVAKQRGDAKRRGDVRRKQQRAAGVDARIANAEQVSRVFPEGQQVVEVVRFDERTNGHGIRLGTQHAI